MAVVPWANFLTDNDSKYTDQRAPNPPEFAQPRLSQVQARWSPARGYTFGCVCSYMAGHEDCEVVTGHIRTNTPKFVPLAGDDRASTLLKWGCANSGGFGARSTDSVDIPQIIQEPGGNVTLQQFEFI